MLFEFDQFKNPELRKQLESHFILNSPLLSYGRETKEYVFVDTESGSDNNSGLGGWKHAKATIQAGVNVARYVRGTTTIDSEKDHRSVVLVAPGHYNVAAGSPTLAFSGYNVAIVGLGCSVPGKDYGVSINYDGATDTTAAIAFSGSGISLHNLHIQMTEALPAIYCAGGDNNLIENCVIEGDGTNNTYGIHMASMKGSRIRNCVIHGFATAGIWVEGGANHYFIHGSIDNNQLYSAVTGAKGILVDNTNVVYNSKIFRNFIDVEPGGATSIGIDNNATGNLFIADNYVAVETAATPIESASNGVLDNKVTVNGTPDSSFNDGE
ncbi:MAG: right-handed parallel beta-helix repeat-containing protein [Promethearchaeota archaeon]